MTARRRARAQAKRPAKPSLHAVILAGGAGERFWPASRRHRPKPFLQVVGGKSLLDATIERARRFAAPENIWIVCGHEHAAAVRREAGLERGRVLVEPQRRNTALAVAWASHVVEAHDPGAVMAVLSADAHIPDARAFARDIRIAAKAAASEHVLVTLGVKPTRPETGYGYIQRGPAVGRAHPRLHRVSRFVEKPDAARARRYVKNPRYDWNAGVFVWGAATLLREVETSCPELHRALKPFRDASGRAAVRSRERVERVYRRAPSLPVDVAVMERSQHVWTLPVDFRWSDVGTWASLAEELGVGRPAGKRASSSRAPSGALQGDEIALSGNRRIAGDVLSLDTSGNLVWGGDRLVALVGVENLAVVDTEDVILITRLDRSPDVRRVVAELAKRRRSDLL